MRQRDIIDKATFYGARYYNPVWGVWLSVDPLAHSFQGVSPFNFNMNNPIMMVDPGGDSTIVVSLGKGKYEVKHAETKSGDRGVYVATIDKNGKRTTLTGEKLGNSITTHSFVDERNEAVQGAVIDMNSNEGQNFIDEIVNDNPGLFSYAVFPKTGGKYGKYDFKNRGIDKRGDLSEKQFRYRGSVTSNGDIGSARDFGNIGAGFVAGRRGLTWEKARENFDGYNGSIEPPVSQLAQRIGFDLGQSYRKQSDSSRLSNPGRNFIGPKL